jgi:hypothetical protein
MSFTKYSSRVSALLFYACGSISSPYFPPYGNLGSDSAINNDLNVYTAVLLQLTWHPFTGSLGDAWIYLISVLLQNGVLAMFSLFVYCLESEFLIFGWFYFLPFGKIPTGG